MEEEKQTQEWASGWLFIFAATGSAVGLGNIWKFPYIAGQNGGGAFVLVYLACVLFMGLPILMAEIMLGRRGHANPIASLRRVALESGRSRHWQWLGVLGITTSFIILSFYSVIAGWSASYIFKSLFGTFQGMSSAQVGQVFTDFQAAPMVLLFWSTLFLIITGMIISGGIHKGLEAALRYMMPSLFVLLIFLVIYAAVTGDFKQGYYFLFAPNWDALSGRSFLVALGHAFFTLSVGAGSMLIYGAYLPRRISIGQTTATIAIIDTLTAVLAGLAIFPIVFANGLTPGAGPGLVFVTLPIAFGKMPFGAIVGCVFFILLLLAALSSSISMIEPTVSWLTSRFSMHRIKATLLASFCIWLLGLGTILSFNIGKNVRLFGHWSYFEFQDDLTSIILLPLSSILLAILSGWVMKRTFSEQEFAFQSSKQYALWRFCVRYIVPVCAFAVMWDLLSQLLKTF